jgi:signal transduction histidine kinase
MGPACRPGTDAFVAIHERHESGLAAAVATLAALPVELAETSRERHSAAVETAAYVTVAEAVADAAARAATFASVGISRNGRTLLVEIRDDGFARTAPLLHVQDRVEALGGSVARQQQDDL